MKLKHRAFSLLLALAMVLTLLPAIPFAEAPEGANTRRATELKYEGDLEYEVDEDDEDDELWFSGFDKPGNMITVIWDDGTEDVFLCKAYEDTESEGYKHTETSYFPKNEEPHWSENKYGEKYIDNKVDFKSKIAADGKITISYDYDYYIESEERYNWDSISTKVQGITPVSIAYEGPVITYDEWDGPTGANPYVEGAKLIISYSDGKTTKVLVCKGWDNSDDGIAWTIYDYFWEDEEPNVVTKANGEKDADNCVDVDFRDEEATEAGLRVEYKGAKGMIPIEEKVYFKPVACELIQPEGNTIHAEIGQKHLWGIEGEGNTIRLTDAEGNVRDYVFSEYGGDEYYWDFFYTDEEGKHALGKSDVSLDKRAPKGTNTVSGKITLECDGYYEYTFPIKVKISASNYYTEVLEKKYTYTGKKITPKVVVKYFNGKSMKTMPTSWYTSNAKKKSAIGEYSYRITIKKKYQKKYGKYLYGWFSVVPKSPKIKSVTGGKEKLTVKWSKLSKSERKNVSYFIVQISRDKKFSEDYDSYWLEKNTVSKYVVDELDPGKYYVRVIAVKALKHGDEVWSKPSKTKFVTVK